MAKGPRVLKGTRILVKSPRRRGCQHQRRFVLGGAAIDRRYLANATLFGTGTLRVESGFQGVCEDPHPCAIPTLPPRPLTKKQKRHRNHVSLRRHSPLPCRGMIDALRPHVVARPCLAHDPHSSLTVPTAPPIPAPTPPPTLAPTAGPTPEEWCR